jgi:hypothetical protein
MNPSADIDTIKQQNFIFKIQSEINCLKNNDKSFGLSEAEITDRLQLLEDIMNNKECKRKMTVTDERDNLFKEIDKYTYKKQWNKLTAFHKIVKIKEFTKDKYGEGLLQDEINTKLSTYINEGKINTKKYITYDPNAEKILSISCLEVDIINKTYKIVF